MSDHTSSNESLGTALPFWRQLRWNLIFYFILLAALPVIIVVAVILARTSTQARAQVFGQLDAVAESKYVQTMSWLEEGEQALNQVLAGEARMSQFSAYISNPEDWYGSLVSTILRVTLGVHPTLTRFLLYDTEGNVVAATDEADIGQVVANQPYFADSLTEKGVHPAYYDTDSDEMVIYVTQPVTDEQGQVVGALAGQFNIESLAAIMAERTGMGETGEAYLVDGQNNYLLTPSLFEGYEFNRAYHSEGIDQALSGADGNATYINYRGQPTLGSYRYIPELQAALLAEIDRSQALAATKQAQFLGAGLAVIAAAVAALLGYITAQQISGPISELTQTATRIAGGELGEQVTIEERNEVGLLASAFNTMTDQFQEMVNTLEDRVQARTRDLATTVEVGQLATSIYGEQELLPRLVEFIRERFDLYYAQIYIIDEAQRYAVLRAGTGEVGEQLLAFGHRLDLDQTSIVAQAVQTNKSVLVSHTAKSDIHLPNPLLPETQSELAIPLSTAGWIIGVLDMQAVQGGTFNEENRPVFEAMASQLAASLQGARAFDEAQAAIERAEAINRRLTAETWHSYLGRVAEGERVAYQYDLEHSTPVEGDSPLSDLASGQKAGAAYVEQPIALRGQQIGSILVGEDHEREWTVEEKALLEDVAGRVAQATDQYRTFDELAEREQRLAGFSTRLQKLQEITQTLAAELSPDEDTYRSTLGSMAQLLNARYAALAILDEAGIYSRFIYYGITEEEARQIGNLPKGKGLLAEFLSEGLPLRIEEITGHEASVGFPAHHPNMHSLLAVPLLSEGRAMGRIYFTEHADGVFDEDDEALANSFAAVLARTLQAGVLFEQAESRARDLMTVAEVSTRVTTMLDIQELLQNVVDTTVERFDLYHAHIYTLDDTGEWLELAAGAGEAGRMMTEAGHAIPYKHPNSVVALAAREREGVIVNDVKQSPTYLPNPMLPNTLAEMSIPMTIGDELIGVLDIQADTLNRFTENDARILGTLAAQVAVAIQNARSYGEAESRARDLMTVAEVSSRVTTTLDIQELLQNVVDTTVERFTLYHAHVYTLDKAGERLALAAGAGEAGQMMTEAGHAIPYDHPNSVVALAARKREGVIVNDVTQSPTFLPNPLLPNTRSEMSIPLTVGDELIGVLDVQADTLNRFTENDARILGTLAAQVAVAVQNARSFGEAESRARDLMTVAEVSSRVTTTLDIQELLQNVVDTTIERFNLYHAHVYTLDGTGEWLALAAGTGEAGQMMTEAGHAIPYDHPNSVVALAARKREGVIVNDVTQSPTFLPNPMLPDTRSEMSIPLTVGDELIGVLDVQADTRNRFTENDARILGTLAAQIAVAIKNAQSFGEAESRARDLMTVAEVSTQVTTMLDIQELLQNVVDTTVERFNLYHAHVYILDEAGERLALAAGAGEAGQMMTEAGHAIPYDHPNSVVALAAREREGVIVNDVTQSPTFLPNPLLPNTRSEMSIPLTIGDELIGVLDVQADTLNRFTENDARILGTLAAQVAVAIQNARSYEEIDESQRLLRAVLDATPDWVWAKDRDFRFILVNRLIADQAFGLTPEEVIGKDDYDFSPPELIEGDPERGIRGFRVDDEQALAGESVHNPFDVVTFTDGSEHILDTKKLPLKDAQGNIVGTLGVGRDVTEREREQRRQVAAYELAQQLTSLLDPDQLIQETVNSVASAFDYYETLVYLVDETQDQLVIREGSGEAGAAMKQRGHSIPLEAERSLVASAARSIEPVVVNDVRRAPDHLPNPLLPETRSEVAIPLAVGQNVLGVLDVQHRTVEHFNENEIRTLSIIANQLAVALQNARLFEQTLETAEQLREVDKLKSEFLANMSHELRTPLNSIIGYSELLIDDLGESLDEMSVEDLKAIHSSGHHLLAIINDVLDLAKIEAGRLQLNIEPVKVEDFIPQVVDMSRVLLKDKPKVELQIELQDDLPTLEADAVRLRQVVWNLLSNAIKFTDEGHVKISSWAEDGWLYIAVEDTGIGIPDQYQSIIFDQFRQIDGSPTRKSGGTGLGLTITRQLVHMHHGDVWVESEYNKGSTFTAKVPIAQNAQPEQATRYGRDGTAGGDNEIEAQSEPESRKVKAAGD